MQYFDAISLPVIRGGSWIFSREILKKTFPKIFRPIIFRLIVFITIKTRILTKFAAPAAKFQKVGQKFRLRALNGWFRPENCIFCGAFSKI